MPHPRRQIDPVATRRVGFDDLRCPRSLLSRYDQACGRSMSSLSGLPVNDASAIERGNHASGLSTSLTLPPPPSGAGEPRYLKILFSFNVGSLSQLTVEVVNGRSPRQGGRCWRRQHLSAYPQVVSRCFALSRVVRIGVSVGPAALFG